MKDRETAKKIVEALDSANMLRATKKEALDAILGVLFDKREKTSTTESFQNDGKTSTTKIELGHELLSDLTGVIYVKDVAIQSFSYTEEKFHLKRLGAGGDVEVVKGKMNEDQSFELYWSSLPGANRIDVKYECLK